MLYRYAFFFLILLVVVVLGFWWFGGRVDRDPVIDRGPLASEDLLGLVQQRALAIARLENGPELVEVTGGPVSGLQLAAEGFSRIGDQVPDEVLPFRNLAIARVLALEAASEKVDPFREHARQAVGALIEVEPASPVGHWLMARVHKHQGQDEPPPDLPKQEAAIVATLNKATELGANDATMWYWLYDAGRYSDDESVRQQSMQALEKAFRLAPQNIYLMTEWLPVQAEQQDPQVVETLQAAKKLFAPLSPRIRQRSNTDIDQIVDQAIAAAQQGNYSIVQGLSRAILNVVRPEEVSKSDLNRIAKHPLEYVLYRYSDRIESQIAKLSMKPPADVPVQMQLVSDDRALPALSGIQQIRVADFDLNGHMDVLALTDNALTIWTRSDQNQWQVMLEYSLPAGMRGVLLGDLDRDLNPSQRAVADGEPQIVPPAGGEGEAPVHISKVLPEGSAAHEADLDVVVYGAGGAIVLRNELSEDGMQRHLVEVEQSEDFRAIQDVVDALLVDFDHDGDLDLVLSSTGGISLWYWMGPIQFQNATAWSVLPESGTLRSLAAVDWDRDVDIDILAVDPSGQVQGYFENLRHGQLRWVKGGPIFDALRDADDLVCLEADGNPSWDLAYAGPKGVAVELTSTTPPGKVLPRQSRQVTDQAFTGLVVADLDNDTFQDLIGFGESTLAVFRGRPDGQFTEWSQLFEKAPSGTIIDCVAEDLDYDGAIDLLIATDQGVDWYRNQGGEKNQWVTIYPMGQADNAGRCNHNAIGSLVEMTTDLRYQAQVVTDQTVHFGLNGPSGAQIARFVWTNGVPQDIVAVQQNVAILEKMVLKGSCPYLYTWDGEKFVFVTDCLWAAPIGLQLAEGFMAPSRAWEYLKVEAEQLQPRDGHYVLQLTEELWEAAYFDKVELIAVDHPDDFEIFSNEKVGPASIAEFKIHTVREPRFPVAAVDQQGRDIQARLAHRDGDFVRAFDRRLRQGLTEPHYIELDLGDLSTADSLGAPASLTLFLTGWIRPTDTSLNIAFSQNPEVDGPEMPSIWVPDADGRWQRADVLMGFPGGKTKTIAVDLSGAFLCSDYRLQIRSTAEIYWDQAFFTVRSSSAAPSPLELTHLSPGSARLFYRGFSPELPHPHTAPARYDHSRVTRQPQWPPMQGLFTRYGDVTTLVQEADDMMIVMGAGDAVEIRFPVPEKPLPPGWRRDFLLHSVGWDKDADLNTVYGQSVEPLPFNAMQGYPYHPGEDFPDTAEHRQYLQTYQTRRQSHSEFWRRLAPSP